MAKKNANETACIGAEYPRKAVPVPAGESEDETALNFARLATSPELAAYRAINAAETASGVGEQLDVPSLLAILQDQAAAANRNDPTQIEAMLINQATALQSLFARLTEKALGSGRMSNFEALLRMALRAQSQCRATLDTLSSIKTPSVVYANQANVTTGPQQVNNHAPGSTLGNSTKKPQNKLSGDDDELLSNSRTSSNEGRINQKLETLGEVNRTKVT
jgi:hypothetical protein